MGWEEEEKEEEEEEEGGAKQRYRIISMEILKPCMDSSMILYTNYLGMDC